MKMQEIINQLNMELPRYTNLFTDEFTVSSLTSSGTTATCVTSTPHGKSVGDFVHIAGALTPNAITTLTQVDNIATAITGTPHDITYPVKIVPLNDPPQTVEIVDTTEPEYNGTKVLTSSANRTTFTYELTGDPSSPATGSPKLLENLKYGYNGWQQITNIVNTTTFEFTLPKIQGSPAQGTITLRINPRISGAVSIERVTAAYTKQIDDKLWAFVTLGNRFASKDRQTFSDATSTPGHGEDFRQLTIQPFSVYVFTPASSEIAARAARDQSEDVLQVLCKSLLRKFFTSVFSEPAFSPVIFAGDAFGDYNGAYYVHEYNFETTEYITFDDTVAPDFGTAFRDIEASYVSQFSNNIFMTDNINLNNDAD